MLAILAQRWNFNVGIDDEPMKYKDFVEQESTFQTLETCFDSAKALRICFDKALEYCEPTKEEFLLAQQTIKDPHSPNEKDNDADSRGSQVTIPIVENPQNQEKIEGSINIWNEKQLVYDENISVQAHKDDFLKRPGGSREPDFSRDAAFKFYIEKIASPHLIIFHSKYSINAYISIFTLKTLSRYLGGYKVPANSNKVIVLERNTTIENFGYAHGLQGSLVGHYLTYTGYALSIGAKDPNRLTPGGKRHLLRHCEFERFPDQENTSKRALEEEEDMQVLEKFM
ncbi:hypothetical protein GOP47_0030643 [Adiantum capillus-veneris]|nr:hypothetical protein GOP47_0030643 [Adiantum capillus-veneris]